MHGTNLDVLQMKRRKLLELQSENNKKRCDLGDQLRSVDSAIRAYEEKELKEYTGVQIYWSDDYAGLSAGSYMFYYGYEETMCLKHDDCDCEDKEWCFTADVDNVEVMRIPESKLKQEDVIGNLLHGIGQFVVKNFSA